MPRVVSARVSSSSGSGSGFGGSGGGGGGGSSSSESAGGSGRYDSSIPTAAAAAASERPRRDRKAPDRFAGDTKLKDLPHADRLRRAKSNRAAVKAKLSSVLQTHLGGKPVLLNLGLGDGSKGRVYRGTASLSAAQKARVVELVEQMLAMASPAEGAKLRAVVAATSQQAAAAASGAQEAAPCRPCSCAGRPDSTHAEPNSSCSGCSAC